MLLVAKYATQTIDEHGLMGHFNIYIHKLYFDLKSSTMMLVSPKKNKINI